MTWQQGEATIRSLLAQGGLQQVPASRRQADRLLQQAASHLESARAIRAVDPAGAFALLYDGTRKALVAVLENQGLRPTSRGGHVVVFQAAQAQLDPPMGATIRPFDRLRRRRNQVEYPSEHVPAVTADEVEEDLSKAAAILAAAEAMVDQMDQFL